MKITLRSFPVVLFRTHCETHGCRVVVDDRPTHPISEDVFTAGQIYMMSCEIGGRALDGYCYESWRLIIETTPGDVTISS